MIHPPPPPLPPRSKNFTDPPTSHFALWDATWCVLVRDDQVVPPICLVLAQMSVGAFVMALGIREVALAVGPGRHCMPLSSRQPSELVWSALRGRQRQNTL